MPQRTGPRLRVGFIGCSHFADALARAGHHARELRDPAEAREVDVVVLDGDEAEWVRGIVEKLVPHLAARQMLVHTCLEEGVQLLDDAELAGAIVMAAHSLDGALWATDAADEVGQAVVDLLVAEAGGTSVSLDREQRLAAAAGKRLEALASVASIDAAELASRAGVQSWEPVLPARRSPADLERLWAAIGDPGAARLFAQLERRGAELRGDAEIELWAIAKENQRG
ncbi:Rossmann-like domain protein [Corynebacterium capitovis DSM 44611]|uniref:6PGD fold domain-containing protein n=1 Tax=Corynebacterium capitovis TaxID=131081 RepID=UPI00036D734E|nr:hypothetical protein [Corynebacterium capitovis]WKD58156.1 Rossmann-like domain protein [Corynebacterium capitovis DSM 44611]